MHRQRHHLATFVPQHIVAAVCWPSPSHLLCTRQHQLLIAELEQLPRVPTTEADLQSTTDLQLQLLQWLFLHLQIKRDFNLMPISLAQLTAEIRAAHCWLSDLSQLDSCRCILRVDNRSSSSPHSTVITGPKLVAYHGTDFSNIHSILHNGLMAASGTRLQGTGAVFGSGVYLAQDFNVAYSFSRAREGWCGSGIGRHLRCVLLCEVDTDMAVQGGSVAVSAAVRWADWHVMVTERVATHCFLGQSHQILWTNQRVHHKQAWGVCVQSWRRATASTRSISFAAFINPPYMHTKPAQLPVECRVAARALPTSSSASA